MMTTATDILASLDAGEIQKRLDEIEAERKALLVLFRSARARERAAQRRSPPPRKQEGPADAK
jgi:hypothetical protein